jgi:hypothetical protein
LVASDDDDDEDDDAATTTTTTATTRSGRGRRLDHDVLNGPDEWIGLIESDAGVAEFMNYVHRELMNEALAHATPLYKTLLRKQFRQLELFVYGAGEVPDWHENEALVKLGGSLMEQLRTTSAGVTHGVTVLDIDKTMATHDYSKDPLGKGIAEAVAAKQDDKKPGRSRKRNKKGAQQQQQQQKGAAQQQGNGKRGSSATREQ